jgi:beta-glucosidase
MLNSWGTASLLMGLALGSYAIAEDVITSDSHFYGESPAVYPSRKSAFQTLIPVISWVRLS